MDVFDAIRNRRSIGKHLPDVPSRALIEQLLAAAVEAPNHYETEPWRFFVISGKAREEFGAVLESALRKRVPAGDKARVEGLAMAERAKPLRSPVLIVVAVKHDVTEKAGEHIVPTEDLQAATAAVQNLVLAAHGVGLAAQWRTGEGAYDPNVKRWFGLDPGDDIAGIVYVGYRDPERDVIRIRRRRWQDKTEWRGWE